ncbi:TPA: Crp/Fnr family transcriptional regulator [Enterobacter ludwigii]
MSRSALRDALRQAPARKYAKNTLLWREGDTFSGLYLVRSGAVKTLRLTPGGEEQITGFYLPGEYIGLDELAADIHRSSAKATLGSEVHRLPALQLYDLMATGAERRHVYQLMSTCLRQNKARFHQLSRMSAGERLAHLIYDLAARYGFQGCVLRDFRIPVLRCDIANYIGVTPETVTREMIKMVAAGAFLFRSRHVCGLRPEIMERLAGPARPGRREGRGARTLHGVSEGP